MYYILFLKTEPECTNQHDNQNTLKSIICWKKNLFYFFFFSVGFDFIR